MKTTTRAFKYLKAGNLNNRWNMLSKVRKRYANYLVKQYGYPVVIAIQQAYIFGYDAWPYDYHSRECVHESCTRGSFGF